MTTKPTIDLDLAAIEKRAEAATPGPWKDDGDARSWDEELGYAGSWIETPAGNWQQIQPGTGGDMVQQQQDARFIAHARTDIPTLLARVRELEADQEDSDRIIAARDRLVGEQAATIAALESRTAALVEAARGNGELDLAIAAWLRLQPEGRAFALERVRMSRALVDSERGIDALKVAERVLVATEKS